MLLKIINKKYLWEDFEPYNYVLIDGWGDFFIGDFFIQDISGTTSINFIANTNFIFCIEKSYQYGGHDSEHKFYLISG